MYLPTFAVLAVLLGFFVSAQVGYAGRAKGRWAHWGRWRSFMVFAVIAGVLGVLLVLFTGFTFQACFGYLDDVCKPVDRVDVWSVFLPLASAPVYWGTMLLFKEFGDDPRATGLAAPHEEAIIAMDRAVEDFRLRRPISGRCPTCLEIVSIDAKPNPQRPSVMVLKTDCTCGSCRGVFEVADGSV
jgi:hypothetical protein